MGATSSLIWIYWSLGEYEHAVELGRGTFPEPPDHSWRASLYLGRVSLTQGNLPQAEARFRKAFSLLTDPDDPRNLWQNTQLVDKCALLQGFACLFAQHERKEQAVQILAAAEKLYQSTGPALAPRERSEHDECLASLRAGLDEHTFAASWTAGQTLTLDQAIVRIAEDLA